MSVLYAALKKRSLGPTVANHQVNGKTTLRWHVDNDDDRYVEAVDSLHSGAFVLHRRDGFDAIIAVIDDVSATVRWIEVQLDFLGRQPSRGEVTT